MIFDETTRFFLPFAESSFHGKCVLSMAHHIMNGTTYFVSGCTGGQIAVFSFSDLRQY
jgi:hypothetical protein